MADIKIEQGLGIEAIKNLLPNHIQIKIIKDKEKVKGKIEYDNQEAEVLNIALVGEDDNLIKKELEFISSKDNKVHKSEKGYLRIGRSDINPFNWITTTFTLRSDEYSVDDEISIAKTTPTKWRYFNNTDYSEVSNEEFEEKLIIVLKDKINKDENENQDNSSENQGTVENPQQPDQNQEQENQNGDNNGNTQEDENVNISLGVKENKVYYKAVDTQGNIVNDLRFTAFDVDGFALDKIVAEKEGDYYSFKTQNEDYIYRINIISDIYEMEKSYTFETGYREGFKRFGVDGEVKALEEIINDETQEKFFTIILKTTEELSTGFETRMMSFALEDSYQEAIIQDSIEKHILVKWDTSNLEDREGEFIIKGQLILEDGLRNTKNLEPKIKIIITRNQKYTTSNQGPASSSGGSSDKDVVKNNQKILEKNELQKENPYIYSKKVVVRASVNSEKIKKGEVEAFIRNGKLMLQLKYLSDIFDIDMKWNQKNKTVKIFDNETEAVLLVKKSKIIINGEEYTTKAEIINGRVYLSLTDISKTLRLTKVKNFSWDNNKKELHMSK